MQSKPPPPAAPSPSDPTLVDSDGRLSGVSTLAMACFVEGIGAEELPLSAESREVLEESLSRLRRESPFVAYAYCLRNLTRNLPFREDV
jgi:hypothetical protein